MSRKKRGVGPPLAIITGRNAPLLIGAGIFIYWIIETFLLDGFTALTLFLAAMCAWSLALASMTHAGNVNHSFMYSSAVSKENQIDNIDSIEVVTRNKEGTANLRAASLPGMVRGEGNASPHRSGFGAAVGGHTSVERGASLVQTVDHEGALLRVAEDASRATISNISATGENTESEAKFAGDPDMATISWEASATASSAHSMEGNGVKDTAQQDNAEQQNNEQRKSRQRRDPLYCRTCERKRPPRTHHCRVCGDCIVLYDHHCVWINNCVGASNLKPFFLFLVYYCLLALHFLFSLACFLFRGAAALSAINARSMGFPLVLVMVLFVPMASIGAYISVSFLIPTSKGILQNSTAYERVEVEESGGQHLNLRYDNGHWLANAKEALGRNVWLWWLPLPVHKVKGKNVADQKTVIFRWEQRTIQEMA